jgi:hypothetical protein
MSIYVYNSNPDISTNVYSTGDYGSISSPVDEPVLDWGASSLEPQTIPDYSTYNYLLPPPDGSTSGAPTEFSSALKTWDSAPNYDSSSIEFSSFNNIDPGYGVSQYDVFHSSSDTFDSRQSEDFGYIYINSTLTAFGNISSSGSLSGEAVTFHYTAPQTTLPITGNALKSLVKTWVGSGTVFEIGSGLERTVKPYIASGTLRVRPGAFGTRTDNDYDTCDSEITCDIGGISALESATKAYNLSSIYDPVLDWGSISSYVTGGDNLGFITQQDPGHFPYDDFGSISNVPTIYPLLPFGQVTFVSSAVPLSFTADTPDNTILYNFSGTALESFSANTPDDTILYNFSGELTHPNIDYTPHYGIDENIGVGTTGIQFRSGVFPERFVFSYNEDTPCYNSIAESLDFGLLTGTPIVPITLPNTDFFDYGLVSEEETGNIPDNFGWIIDELTINCPFGSINIVNGFSPKESYPWLPEPGVGRSWSFTKGNYISSGNILISGTSIESFTADTPEDTQLFIISGTLIEKNTESYVGVGIAIFSGTALESFSAQTPEDTILYSFSGTALESFSAQTPEDTVLYSFSGTSIESFTADTPEDTQLFIISGTLIEKNTESYVGLGTVTLSGTALESFSAQTPEDTILYSFSGTALESFSAQTPEDTVLYNFSGAAVESFTADTPEDTQLFIISGFGIEQNTESYVGLGTVTLSGTALESFTADTPENTQLFNIYGELVHPNIDYTPHYGIEKNIGIGTTGIQFRVGVGTFPDGDGNPRDAKTYSNRYGFLIGDFNQGSGIGTIRFSSKARTLKVPRYPGQGSIYVIGSGNESFSKSNYDGSGIITLSGIASTREINVYGYYGDDNNPGTSGTIFLSQQVSTIEKNTEVYLGIGTIFVSETIIERNTESYVGFGTGTLSGTALESFAAQTPEDTQLFNIFGSCLEVYSAQTPETEVLYIINGFIEESITHSYDASGSVTLNGSSNTFYVPNYPASGTIRFANTHHVDNLYDTCDSEDITSDEQDSANVSFTANPPENTVLFNIDGSALAVETALYTEVADGLFTLSGSYQDLKFSYSQSGIGTIFITEISSESERNVYVGSGNIFVISGASESYSSQTPENTQLFQISGSAVTSVEVDYPVVGIGLFALSGSAVTSEIATYTQIGSGTITLSGELVYSDVIYIPSPDGSGTINVLGSSNNSLIKTYDETDGNLFGFSSGLESFTKSTYIGVGTIYIQEVFGSTNNNPFQIPRTYVVII